MKGSRNSIQLIQGIFQSIEHLNVQLIAQANGQRFSGQRLSYRMPKFLENIHKTMLVHLR